MAVFKCKMCGGTLDISENQSIAKCKFCGATQTLPRLDSDRRINLYDRANHFRRNNDFDKAMAIYENILNEDLTDAEAYWSLVLCNYGIEYVEDPATKRHIPTVNRAQFTSVFDDENYKSAIANADEKQKEIYESEAAEINEIQKKILAIAQNEEPFDVFICYKETDANGRRTRDSVDATDLYYQLKNEGFKVFFAKITLEDKLGVEYEPYIFAALNSAKVMVVLGSKQEYFNAVWVKNEWSRYLALVKKAGGKKMLIPAYRDMDPYDLPDEFSHLQAQDMSKLGFMQDLVRGIKKILGENKSASNAKMPQGSVENIVPMLKRAFLFIEDENWQQADEYLEKVLDIDPENGEAYLGKLMIEYRISRKADIASAGRALKKSRYFEKVARFGDDAAKKLLENIQDTCDDSAEGNGDIPIVSPYKERSAEEIAREFSINKSGVLTKYKGSDSTVYIPESVKAIGNEAFINFRDITTIVIPNSVTSIGAGAFKGCIKLKSINIPNGVAEVGSDAFDWCKSLKRILFPSSVVTIGRDIFVGCDSLESIAVEKNNPIYYSVDNCIIETASKTIVAGCKTSVFPNDGSVERIGDGAFCGCNGLTEVVLPDSIKYVGKNAFSCCKNLTSFTLSRSFIDREIKMNFCIIDSSAFDGSENLCTIVIPDGVSTIGSSTFNCFRWEYYDSSDKYNYRNGNIYSAWPKSVTSIIIPESVTEIGIDLFGYFENTIETLTIPKNVAHIDKGALPTKIGNIIVDKNNTAYHSAGNCLIETASKTLIRGLKNSVIPDDGSVTSIGDDAFHGVEISDIHIPSSVTSIGRYAFAYSNLQAVKIPESVAYLGEMAFCGCRSLKSVEIASGLKTLALSAFGDCQSLTDVNIALGLESIGETAFGNCICITEIILPKSVKNISKNAFRGCKKLQKATIPFMCKYDKNAFDSQCKISKKLF